MRKLKQCPLCGSKMHLCGGADFEDEHGCHMFVCEGCSTSFDCSGDYNPETLKELQDYCAEVFNKRYIPDAESNETE